MRASTTFLAHLLLFTTFATACTSTTTDGGSDTTTQARTIPESIPGWKVALRVSPKQRQTSTGMSLPGALQVRGFQELDGKRHLFTWMDTEPRTEIAEPLVQDTVFEADGTATSTEVANTPWNEGQIFWFSGQDGFFSTMRSTEIAQFNGNAELWPAPDTYIFSEGRYTDGMVSFKCTAKNQSAGVQDVCDSVTHQMSAPAMTGASPIDMMMLPDGKIAYAATPYPSGSTYVIELATLKLGPTRGLTADIDKTLTLSTQPYFSSVSVTLTYRGDYVYGITAGRLSADDKTGASQWGLAGAKLNIQTGEITSLGEFLMPSVNGVGVRDPLTGRIAWVGHRLDQPKDLPPEPGMTSLKLQTAAQVAIFDPATESFRALPDLPVRIMTTDDYPKYMFLASTPEPKLHGKSLPGSVFWSGGKLYVVQTEIGRPPNLWDVVREVVIWTPDW